MTWMLLGIAIILLAVWVYWHIVITEGAYLGQGVVTWLYDLTAARYNGIKEFEAEDEQRYLADPLLQMLGGGFRGQVLDVATGTGRLPLALGRHPQFKGQVIGLDHSRRMLFEAHTALPQTPLLIADAMALPFASNSVPAVTCLEALEFLPQPQQAMAEMARVLQPGGLLLATRRIGWEARLMPGKTWSKIELTRLLQALAMTDIHIHPWQVIYDQVWARKAKTERLNED